jgi:DNA-binding transcriptional MerR regulator
MLKAYQKKEVMNDFNMMKEFTTLIADIKDQIERLKAKKSEGLTIAATNTLIKLYSVMCQFASVFYNNQDGNIQEKLEEQAQQEEEELQNRISILTFEELKLFQALVYKIEIQDEGIDVISNINNKSAAVMYELLDVVPNIVPEAKIQTKPRLKRTILPNNELSDLRVREI